MKKPHLTLYGQILLWFFLNLTLVAGVLFLVLQVQFKVGLWSLFSGQVNERIEATGELMAAELRGAERSEWEAIVARHAEAHGVSFALLRPDGDGLLAGEERELPAKLKEVLRKEFPPPDGPGEDGGENPPNPRGPDGPPEGPERGGPPERRGPPREFGRAGEGLGGPGGRRPEPAGGRPPGRGGRARVVYYERDSETGRYWLAASVSLRSAEHRHPPDGMLVASVERLGGNDLFFDWRPWFWALLGVLVVSALIWFPFVHRVTRRLRQLTAAAESISEGDFDVEVASKRTDELGRLSRAVQRMAQRLDDYVSGQKRFLGDIAHELCSPLVRARMSLGILEQELSAEEQAKLEAVNEEVEELSQLVNELLDFSKASLKPEALPMGRIDLAELVQEVVRREAPGVEVVVMVAKGLSMESNADLLRRALGNVIRNAVRYTPEGGEIVVRVVEAGERLAIQVLDRGPGVPEEWLSRVFEPFSRPEKARTRESGGAGLGLAISKTCTEALGGSVRGRNRSGGGFAVEFRFPLNR
ncbi:MAG: ATP-binding protein [Verrucomicrobia bacterium]|nr:ATP-binding protein [Verrucomicrobiota bacterium]